MTPMNNPKFTIVNNQLMDGDEPIPQDEPLFILRASDPLALRTLLEMTKATPDSPQRAGMCQRMREFNDFATNYPDRMKRRDDADQ